MKLGQNIAIYRKEAGLTQEQLAGDVATTTITGLYPI